MINNDSYVPLKPSKNPTVSCVGEYAYKHNAEKLTSGLYQLELVPEPDNPHDDHAISVRYKGKVVGYIPRDRTQTYWPMLARIAASGKTAQVQARVYKSSNGYFDISLFLLSGDKALLSDAGLIPKASQYDVPKAYMQKSNNPEANTKERSAKFAHIEEVTFTEAEREAESQRREQSQSNPSPSSNSGFIGCGILIAVIIILLILIF